MKKVSCFQSELVHIQGDTYCKRDLVWAIMYVHFSERKVERENNFFCSCLLISVSRIICLYNKCSNFL